MGGDLWNTILHKKERISLGKRKEEIMNVFRKNDVAIYCSKSEDCLITIE